MEYKKVRFNKACGNADTLHNLIETKGLEVFEMHGSRWVAHQETESTKHGDFTVWEISELSTGFRLSFKEPCFDLEQAITRAKEFLREIGMPKTVQALSRVRKILEQKA